MILFQALGLELDTIIKVIKFFKYKNVYNKILTYINKLMLITTEIKNHD